MEHDTLFFAPIFKEEALDIMYLFRSARTACTDNPPRCLITTLPSLPVVLILRVSPDFIFAIRTLDLVTEREVMMALNTIVTKE